MSVVGIFRQNCQLPQLRQTMLIKSANFVEMDYIFFEEIVDLVLVGNCLFRYEKLFHTYLIQLRQGIYRILYLIKFKIIKNKIIINAKSFYKIAKSVGKLFKLFV